jgi:hypothetical protein
MVSAQSLHMRLIPIGIAEAAIHQNVHFSLECNLNKDLSYHSGFLSGEITRLVGVDANVLVELREAMSDPIRIHDDKSLQRKTLFFVEQVNCVGLLFGR